MNMTETEYKNMCKVVRNSKVYVITNEENPVRIEINAEHGSWWVHDVSETGLILVDAQQNKWGLSNFDITVSGKVIHSFRRNSFTENKNIQRHLNHPFYKKVDEVTEEVAHDQILKGAGKYDEPFTPKSWTGPQLVRHQLEELRDAQVYSVGLLELVVEMEEKIKRLEESVMKWKKVAEINHRRNKGME